MPLIIFMLFFAAGIVMRERALSDPDTGWHIAAGDLIRELGRLPQSDPWSYTAGDQPWYNLSWAYDVVLSIVHQIGGLSAVTVMTVFLYAAAVALVAAVALRLSRSVIASMIVTLLSGAILMSGMLARPQLVSFLLVIGVYSALRFGSGKQLWIIPLLMIVWANAHGAFLSGFVIIGMFFFEALAARDRQRVRRVFAVGAVSGLALLANPYGIGIIDAAQLTMSSVLKPYLIEWRPTVLTQLNLSTIYLVGLVAVWGFFDRRIPLADRLLAAFWLAVGLTSARMMQMTALLAAPYFAHALALRLAQAPFAQLAAARDRSYADDLSRPAVQSGLSVAAIMCVILASMPPMQRLIAGGGSFAVIRESVAPARAVEFLDAHYPDIRLYNQYDFGGWLALNRRGAPKVFFDGRADTAFPRQALSDGVTLGLMSPHDGVAEFDEARWRTLVGRYGIEGFLLAAPMRLKAVLSDLPDWAKLYEDGTAVIFVRADLVDESED